MGRKEQAHPPRKKLDGQGEAHLIALACGEPPEGRASWTLQLLADQLVQREIVESISPDTVGRCLKKNEFKPWLKECWSIPPKGNAEFVCAMEDVLEVYQRRFEDNGVLVCLDRTSKQLAQETRQPRPARPGSPLAYDYEYQREGVSNLFMMFAPLDGRRRVEVRERRTRVDWAQVIKKLVDEDYADRERIVLETDNLNTRHPASLYRAFEPAEARRIAQRLEIHYTPEHGSWLNLAECELAVLARQCPDRRIPTPDALKQETQTWQRQRNGKGIRADWRFTTQDARIRLKYLYPSFNSDELLAQLGDWKLPLTVFGVLGILGGLIWLWAGRDSSAVGAAPAPISLQRAASVVRTRSVLLLIAADAGILVQYAGLTSWLPSFYSEQRGLSLAEAGFVTGVLPFVGIFAVLAGGALPLRIGSARTFFVASGLFAGFGGLGTFLLPELPAIYLSVVALGVGSWFYIPTLLTLPLKLDWVSPENLAVIYGSIMMFSGIAMFVSPIVVGAMRDVSGSFLLGFVICAAPGWMILLTGLLMPREIVGRPA